MCRKLRKSKRKAKRQKKKTNICKIVIIVFAYFILGTTF